VCDLILPLKFHNQLLHLSIGHLLGLRVFAENIKDFEGLCVAQVGDELVVGPPTISVRIVSIPNVLVKVMSLALSISCHSVYHFLISPMNGRPHFSLTNHIVTRSGSLTSIVFHIKLFNRDISIRSRHTLSDHIVIFQLIHCDLIVIVSINLIKELSESPVTLSILLLLLPVLKPAKLTISIYIDRPETSLELPSWDQFTLRHETRDQHIVILVEFVVGHESIIRYGSLD